MDKTSFDCTEEPLRGYQRQYSQSRNGNRFHGPLKAVRLCILAIVLPGLFIAVPVYMKFRVYDYQLYPVGMADMRLIDNKISTTWCQKQLVKFNSTFNAFLMPSTPAMSHNHLHLNMTRVLNLADDMKEYWGFYLLKGSTVTVSTCSRYPGASLILIKGHRNLHECAYIGDDSSEEIEEILDKAKSIGIHTLDHTVDNPSNEPDLLRKHTADVNFHDPETQLIAEKYQKQPNKKISNDDNDEINAKEMKELLHQLNTKVDNYNKKQQEKSNAKKSSKMQPVQQDGVQTVPNVKESTLADWNKNKTNKHYPTFDNKHVHREPTFGKEEIGNVVFEDNQMEVAAKHKAPIVESKNQTSAEIFKEVLNKLKELGPRGHKILYEIKAEMENNNLNPTTVKTNLSANTTNIDVTDFSEEFIKENLKRVRKDIVIENQFIDDLNRDDEDENLAIEQGFVPDGHAQHHERINETTLNDRSNSEYWSSFSSSEEALLNCAGLILSLPLIPKLMCDHNVSNSVFEKASLPNKVSYHVPSNGYYFFVFSSENEKQINPVRVHFDLKKSLYNISQPLDVCNNSTTECSFPLNFFSDQKVVFEMPLSNNDSMWNGDYVVVSECEPRTIIYLICVLSVPLMILLFAFQ